MKKILCIGGVIVLAVLLFSSVTVIQLLAGIVAVSWFHLFLKRKSRNFDEELGGGFSHYAGIDMKELELLRIMVLEQLERFASVGRSPVAKETRRKRIMLTTGYILFSLLFLIVCYYKAHIIAWMTGITLVYTFLYFLCDPVDEICREVKKQPDREIAQVVLEMTSDRPQRSLKPVGIVAAVLSLLLLFAGSSTEDFSFEPVGGGYCLTKFRPSIFGQTQAQIPETYQGLPVVAIGEGVFEGMDLLTSVQIPETVVSIGSCAFKGCSRLDRVLLPTGLLTLNGESFKGCSSLREITIPKGVVEIRGNTFEDCTSLRKAVLHDDIVDIHAYAFRNCEALAQITLPTGITQIHAYTFEDCTSLESIVIPAGVTRIAAHAFNNCSSLQDVSVPSTLKEIRSSAFRDCDALKQIRLPFGVIVDERAFKDSPTHITYSSFILEG